MHIDHYATHRSLCEDLEAKLTQVTLLEPALMRLQAEVARLMRMHAVRQK